MTSLLHFFCKSCDFWINPLLSTPIHRLAVRMEAVLMRAVRFPVIDPIATGANIARLRQERGLTVRDLQLFFGFEEPQAIYKWQRGQSLPSVDNLYALSRLFQISMNEILVPASCYTDPSEQQAAVCCSNHRAGDVLLKRRLRRASKLPGSGPFKRLKRLPCFSRRMIRLNEQLAAIPG